MPILEIDGKQFEAKTTFKFQRTANERYKMVAQGQEVGGLESIYMNLLDYNPEYLLAFWDCALSYLKNDKPSVEKIEEALEKRIEEDGDTESLFKEAFKSLDDSGFFKKQVQAFWKNLNLATEAAGTKEEKKVNQQMAKMMRDKYNELIA